MSKKDTAPKILRLRYNFVCEIEYIQKKFCLVQN